MRENDDPIMLEYRRILAREFRKARGLPEHAVLDIAFRTDESIVIAECGNFWIMQIGSDDDDFDFFDNEGVECRFPMPEDWLKLEEAPR